MDEYGPGPHEVHVVPSPHTVLLLKMVTFCRGNKSSKILLCRFFLFSFSFLLRYIV